MRLEIKYHFCITLCPRLTTVKDTAKQTTSIGTSLCWDEMSPAHASTETKKKNQTSSFPHKAQDKINPTHRFKAEMSECFPGFCFFAIASTGYRDSSTLFMTENPTVVQNKTVNSNFYSYTICE